MFGSLRKKLEEITAQVNPFDNGRTASTVRASRQQAPPAQTINRPNQSFANKVFDQVSSNTQADQYRRQQQQRLVQDSTRGTDEAMRNLQKQALTGQVDKNVAAAKIRALGTSNVQPNTAENVLKPTTPAQIAGQKVVDTTMNRKVAPVALGVGRSAAGTVRGVSGLYDLASPGDGVNRISKQAVQAGQTTDQTVKDNNYNQIAYKGAQAATDLATFGVAGKATKAVPGVSSVLTKVDDLAKPVSNVSAKLATKGFGGRVAGATLKNVANPRYQAANAGFTALEAGKQSANGQQVTPMGVTTNLVAGGVGFPVAGAVVGQTAKPVINAGVNQLRKTNLIRPSKLNPNEVVDLARLNDTAKTGAIMEDGVYQRGVQAAQKAGVDYNNPTAVDDLLGKHRTFDTISSQRKQAIDEAKLRLANPRPLNNEIGAVGKNVNGADRPTVYHGTRANFDKFEGGHQGVKVDTNGGFYFSPMKEVADVYAGTKYGKGRVVEAQLDIKNPKIAKSYEEIGKLTKEDIAKAKAEGYDGYYYKPSDMAIKNGSESSRNEEWVAFDDKQIIRPPQPQPVGKDVNKRAPKSPFEKDLQSAGLTGNKAVRPKENTVQTPKNQSQSTPKTEQPVAPQLAETANQTKAPQTKGRATSSELGQGERITSETPKRTASQSPEVKSNIVNPSIRERGFVETIIDDPKTSPKVKENLSSLYSVRNTKQLQTKAANLVKTDPDLAMRVAREDTSDIGVATGSELIKKLQQDGNYEQAIDLATNVAETLTKAGQTSQAASIYGKLTPEGILRFTQKEINAYNKATKKNIKLSPEQAKSLTEKAQKIQEMPEGRPRDIATQQMLKELYETMPSTWVEKVSTFQTMAQLLNPKTLIRNLGGNTIFSVLDNSSQVLATGIDKAISGVKGTPRTTTLPSIKTQAKGLKKGFNEGYEEAVKGINLGPRTQFELNDVPVFRDGLLGKAETGLNLSLRATDRAAYTAAFDDTLKGLMKTNKAKTATTEMIEIAHHQGLYRTFQDESNAAKIFVGLKKALNIAGFEQNGKRWGLGDLILKYPKTPGNLIARGIDYSPVGILKGMINLTQLNQGPIKQQAAANSIARGVTGTGSLIGTGYVLAGLGLITEKPEDNKDLRNLQKSAGLGGYQLNTSGLRRFLLSGFDTEEAKLKPGDKLVSYDWAQPAAIPLSMGASMGRGEGVKKGASQGLNALSEGVETLAEQPLVRGVQQFFGSNKSAADSVVDTVKSAPASFVPTLSNQVRQLTDNTTRNTSDPSALKEAYNKAINRVPGIAGQLPAQVDTLGNDKKNFQNGSNNPFNVFLNPSFVNKYQPNNVATTNLDLNRATGETKQLPNTVSNKVKINGQDKVLTGKEQGDYQKFVGQTNSTITDTLTKNPRFNALPDSQKVNLLASMQTDINNAAKVNLFGDNPEKLSESVDSILSGNVERAIELKLKTQEKTVEKKSGKKVAKAKSTKKKSSGKKGGKKGGKGKAKKGKFDYTKNLFGSTGTATSGSVSKSLRAILENAQKSSSKK